MSKKHNMHGYDESDSDSDELAILGSRFAHIGSGTDESPKRHRTRYDSDGWDDRAPKRKSFRPREKALRDENS